MANPTRIKKMESVLRREIATVLTQQARDPRLGFVTITRVELTGDLEVLTAYYTILGDAKKRNLATHALDSLRGFVQQAYAKVLHTRRLPQLRWKYDEQETTRSAMDELIRQARASDTDRGERPEPPIENPAGPPALPPQPQ